MATILVIEDNTDIRENTAELLELAGHKVITAHDGRDGILKAMTMQAELVICDIQMPGMDGYEVLQYLRSEESTAGIPFIYLTAFTENADVKKGFEKGANRYLRKPFGEQELMEAVTSCLKKQ